MCGIAGIFSKSSINNEKLISIGKEINKTLYHRGPDENGLWINDESNLLFAHTRLSILDFSNNGSQPMHSSCGRYVIIFNGEIYNHKEIEKNIKLKNEGMIFNGHSDTEILIECISIFGLEYTLKKANGMFAIALWDKKDKTLKLARDRFGEKPLYYTNQNNKFLFASELSAFKCIGEFNKILNYNSIQHFLNYSYIPSPLTIYKNVYKLMPSTILEIERSGKTKELIYWKLDKFTKKNNINKISEKDNVSIIENKLSTIVKSQMISDAPIGSFLSGGTDSTVISLMMQKQLSNKLDTFSVGYEDKRYDESNSARNISEILGSNHNELILSDKDIMNIIPNLPTIYDEPFADSSQLPSVLIANYASQKVKVCLTGDGGDEVFGGYNRHLWVKKYWPIISKMPIFIRKLISNLLKILPERNWDQIYKIIFNYKKESSLRLFGEKIYKIANSIDSKNLHELHDNFLKTGSNSYLNTDYTIPLYDYDFPKNSITPLETFMYMDLKNYLCNDILVKLDRSSMSSSLETRLPFLDHELVEYVYNLPDQIKMKNNKTKWILKKILEKHFPKHIVNKSKMGFGVPIDEWLRGPLKEWSLDLISSSRYKKFELINYSKVNNDFDKHIKYSNNFHHKIWNVLMLQSWIDNESL